MIKGVLVWRQETEEFMYLRDWLHRLGDEYQSDDIASIFRYLISGNCLFSP